MRHIEDLHRRDFVVGENLMHFVSKPNHPKLKLVSKQNIRQRSLQAKLKPD